MGESSGKPVSAKHGVDEGGEQWQSGSTTNNRNRTRGIVVLGMAVLAVLVLGSWLWPMQELSDTDVATVTVTVTIDATPTPSSLRSTTAAIRGTDTIGNVTSPTRVPTRAPTWALPTSTPEHYGILSLLRIEQLSPIASGEPLKVRAYWRVGALPNTGSHTGVFFMQLIGPDGALLAQSETQSEGSMRAYRVGAVYAVDHLITIPNNADFGEYTLSAGIYDLVTGERWPVLMSGQAGPNNRVTALRFRLAQRYPLTLNQLRVDPLQPKAGEPITVAWWFSGSANSVAIQVFDIDGNVDINPRANSNDTGYLKTEYPYSSTQVESQRGEMTVQGIHANQAPLAVGLWVDQALLALVPLNMLANDALIQPFEHGHMLWLRDTDAPFIYVLYENGDAQRITMRLEEGQVEAMPAVTAAPPAGMLQPQRSLGWVWRTYSDVRERLGWALQAEQRYRACVLWQTTGNEATKDPLYVTDPNGQVYLFERQSTWQYQPGLLGAQPC